jgi:prepilin-type N-terminal cleavage/methylation domain-containing protein
MSTATPGRNGFSLIECLFVICLGAVLATVAVANIHRVRQEWTLWGGVISVEETLQWGRMHAVISNSPLMFKVSENGNRHCWVDADSGEEYAGTVRTMPEGLKIASSPKQPLRFYQHGNAVPAGTYVVSGNTGSIAVIVSPGGRIRTEKK